MPHVSLSTLVDCIHAGGYLISFPTDTVPALSARPDQAELIFTAKQRSYDKPLILMGAIASDLWPYVVGTPEEYRIWQQVAERYWPGPLTLVLPASDRLPPGMNPTNTATIGVRVPDHAIARKILAQTGPLATTSANLSGQPALQTMAEIEAQFPKVFTLRPVDLLALEQDQSAIETKKTHQPQIKSNSTSKSASGMPSTIAKWAHGNWEILRQGSIQMTEAR
ncbi:MAG: L-threonylcarbamoyladenylate synthase [Cyanothece sp. SIO1E1]|nr:L-threonylcarbamoyladenylate synthase [Cyanothece sp. SIO1E1]